MQHGGQQLGRKLQREEESSLEKGHVRGFHNDVEGKNVWKPTDTDNSQKVIQTRAYD